jgi:UDP-2,4-diacetamido-2,4,6-trideoxy-beta-L-altropyranose hydrolase
MNNATLIIRADASPEIGIGHVMRCLAIAQSWEERVGQARFACARIMPALSHRLSLEGFAVDLIGSEPEKKSDSKESDSLIDSGSAADAEQLSHLARKYQAKAIVFDGYRFDADYLHKFRSCHSRTMLIDDFGHSKYYDVDLVLNQNLNADARLYDNRSLKTKLLLGPTYALLRKEFRGQDVSIANKANKPSKLLVSLGGSNYLHLLSSIFSALRILESHSLETRLIVCGSEEQVRKIRVASSGVPRLEILENISDMATQYRWADIALAAGGSSNWEMCRFGLPRALLVLADNQVAVANELSKLGAVLSLGRSAEVSAEQIADAICRMIQDEPLRRSLRERSADLIDGAGADRCVDALCQTKVAGKDDLNRDCISFRIASNDDWKLLLDWRNDVATRNASRTSQLIQESQHREWLSKCLADRQRELLIAESNGNPIGTVRVDYGEVSELSWTVAPAYRGLGYGGRMLREAIKLLAESRKTRVLQAVAREDNLASTKMAESVGFQRYAQDGPWISFRMELKAN